MKNKEYVSLQKMIEYIDKSIVYTDGYTFEELQNIIVTYADFKKE